eukprot:260227_1
MRVVSNCKLSKRKTLMILIMLWLIVTLMIYFGFLHVQNEHAHLELVQNPIKRHAILQSNKRNDIKNFKSSGLLSFALMIRSTILVDPVSQFYQSVFPSLLAFWNENLCKDLTIVLDEDRYYPTYWMDEPARDTLKPILNVIFKKEATPKYWNKLYLTGYDRQQYSTLQLDKYTDNDIIIMLDTDSPFIVMPTRQDFVDDKTNKIKLIASNIYGGVNRQHDWSASCKLLFNKFLIDGMTMLPAVYHRSTLINFRKYFTEILRRHYLNFIIKYNKTHSNYGYVDNFNIDDKYPLNNTEMDRTILYVLNDPTDADKFTFADAFMFFASNFSNKPYSEYTLLMNYAYIFEHDKYEWHIDNWNIENENKPHHRITGHWKYAKPLTEKYARVTCCHIYDNYLLNNSFCNSVKNYYPDLNTFVEDWFIDGDNFYSVSPQFSDICTTHSCHNAIRWKRDDEKTIERYEMMKDMVNPQNGIFTQHSLAIKHDNCLNISRLRLNQVYQYIRLRHKGLCVSRRFTFCFPMDHIHNCIAKGKHGQLPTPLDNHRNYFRDISNGKY